MNKFVAGAFALCIGVASVAANAQGGGKQFDPHTQGARAGEKFDPHTQGARSGDKFDPYSQGANKSTRADLNAAPEQKKAGDKKAKKAKPAQPAN
jgi:hypothetical protein